MTHGLKQLLSRLLHRAGYTLVPNWRLEHYSAAMFLQRLFRFLDVDCVLDVGANLGQYRDFLRYQVGYQRRIISFEPIPALVDLLRARAASDPEWLIEGYALGSTPHLAGLNVMASTAFSSFLNPDHSKVHMFERSNEVRQRVEVEVKLLDEVLPMLEERLSFRHLYLKLDTQGYDFEIIKGAAKSLPRVCALQTEASVIPIYSGMPDYATVIRALEDLDFMLSGIFPNNPDHFPQLIEFDCYMTNRALVP